MPSKKRGKSTGTSHRRLDSLPETSFHFFKIILPSTIQEKKLLIPVRFVKKFGHELSGVARLNGPDDRTWQVGLEKDQDTICFANGWHEFVQFYSIRDSYLLVFRYVGKLNFHVVIFDTSACESRIGNPGDMVEIVEDLSRPSKKRSSSSKEKFFPDCTTGVNIHKIDDDVEILDFHDEYRMCFQENNHQLSYLVDEIGNKISEGTGKKATEDLENVHAEIGDNDHEQSDSSERMNQNSSKHSELDPEMHNDDMGASCITGQIIKRTYGASKTYETEKPSFAATIKKHNISRQFVYVPREFARRYLCRGGTNTVILQVDQKKWCVQHCKNSAMKYNTLRKGWATFAADNKLEEGDVCIFKSTEADNIVLKVSIYHIGQDSKTLTKN